MADKISDPFTVAAEIALEDTRVLGRLAVHQALNDTVGTAIHKTVLENEYVDKLSETDLSKTVEGLAGGVSNIMRIALDKYGPEFLKRAPRRPEQEVRDGITAGLNKEFSARAAEQISSPTDIFSPEKSTALLNKIADTREKIEISETDKNNALGGLKNLGVEPTEKTLTGMAHLIRVALELENDLAPGGFSPPKLKSPTQ